MSRRKRFTSALLAAGALVLTSVGLTALPAQAADINGCTIVPNPTPTNYTSCTYHDFTGADLSNLDLSYARLSDKIAGANFSRSKLIGASLGGGSAAGTNFTDADMTDAKITYTDLQTATLIRTRMDRMVARYSNFSGQDLSGQSMVGAVFDNALMRNVRFTGADVRQALFTAADLSGAILDALNMTTTVLYDPDTWTGGRTNLSGASARGTDFSGISIGRVDFHGAVLEDASFCGVSDADWASDKAGYDGTTVLPAPPTTASLPAIPADVYLTETGEERRTAELQCGYARHWDVSTDGGATWTTATATNSDLVIDATKVASGTKYRAVYTESLMGRTTLVPTNVMTVHIMDDVAPVTATFGTQRTSSSEVAPLKDVSVQLWDGDANGPTAPLGDGWATATSDAAGNVTFSVPDAAPGGVNFERQLWLVPTAPAGYTPVNTMIIGDQTSIPYGAQRTQPLIGGTPQHLPAPTASGNAASSGIWAMALANPERPKQCGVDVALVVDLSSSVERNGGLANLQTAATTFVDALTGTPSRVGLYTFDRFAPATTGTTMHSVPVNTAAGAQQLKTAINGLELGTDTNWDSALRQVSESGETYDVVLMLTDGAPTVSVGGTGEVEGSGDWANVASIERAIFSANALKAAGTQVVAVGVGDGLSGDPANLVAISGVTPGIDFFQTADYAAAGDTLYDIAVEGCESTITVVQQVIPADADSGDYAAAVPTAGFDFTVNPYAGTVAQTEVTTGQLGAVNIPVNLATAGSSTVVAISPAPRDDVIQLKAPNYDNAVCTLRDGTNAPGALANRADGGMDVLVAEDAPTVCTFYAQALATSEPAPEHDPTDPGDGTTEPEPTDPGDGTTEPDPTDPGDVATEPEPDPVDPGDGTTEPEPSDSGPTDPCDGTTEPDPVDPGDGATEPEPSDPGKGTAGPTSQAPSDNPEAPDPSEPGRGRPLIDDMPVTGAPLLSVLLAALGLLTAGGVGAWRARRPQDQASQR